MAHIKSKYFPALLLTSSIIVEACAVFFSVYGLTKLFAGAALAIGVMATSLELAKVVSVSYVYRYWNELGRLYRAYMVSAVVVLMLITSLGIYGFLSNAFQGSTLGLEKDIAKLTLQEDEISRVKEDNVSIKVEKDELRKSMTAELDGLVIKEESRYVDVNKRTSVSRRYQVLIKEKDKQLTENNKKIETLSQQITDSKVTMIDTGADVGPIVFVSRAFDVDVSTVVQYLILLFILVFDPLALALIIGFNKLIIDEDEYVLSKIITKKEENKLETDQITENKKIEEEEIKEPPKQSETVAEVATWSTPAIEIITEDIPEVMTQPEVINEPQQEDVVVQSQPESLSSAVVTIQPEEPHKTQQISQENHAIPMKNMMKRYGDSRELEDEGITYVNTAKDSHNRLPNF